MAALLPTDDELMQRSRRELMAMAGTRSKKYSKRKLIEMIRTA